MVRLRHTPCSHLQPLLAEVVRLVEACDWNCSVSHIFREANFCADMLAELGHQGGFQWTLLDYKSTSLGLLLDADIRGFTSVRLVH